MRSDARSFPMGSVVRRAFCTVGDRDWYAFEGSAQPGMPYYIEIAEHGADVLTKIDPPGPEVATVGEMLIQVFPDRWALDGTVRILVGLRPNTGAGPDHVYDIRIRTVPWVNRFVNGDFEADADGDDSPDGWSFDARFSRVPGGLGGGHARQFEGAGSYLVTKRAKALRHDRTYRIAGHILIPPTEDAFGYEGHTRLRDRNDAVVDSFGPWMRFFSPTDGWQPWDDGDGAAPVAATATSLTLQLRPLRLDDGLVLVDDVVLGEYPPPATPPGTNLRLVELPVP